MKSVDTMHVCKELQADVTVLLHNLLTIQIHIGVEFTKRTPVCVEAMPAAAAEHTHRSNSVRHRRECGIKEARLMKLMSTMASSFFINVPCDRQYSHQRFNV